MRNDLRPSIVRALAGLAVLGILMVAAAAPAAAAAQRWSRFGPGSGDITAFGLDASAPGTIYLAQTFGGISRSLDSGLSWAPAAVGLDGEVVRDIASFGSAVLAVTSSGKVFRSDDHGASWTVIHGGRAFQQFPYELDPFGNARLLPAPGGVLYLKMRFGVYRSDNEGRSWRRILAGEPEVGDLALDPNAPGTLYASLTGDGQGPFLVKSTDGGQTWQPTGSTAQPAEVKSLAVLPTRPATILAGSYPGLFRSADGGATWTKIQPLEPNADWSIYSFATVPGAPGTVYAAYNGGALLSTDAGLTWRRPGPGFFDVDGRVVFDPATGILFGVQSTDLARSGNGGRRWRTVYRAGALNVLAFKPGNPSIVFLGGRTLFRSTDGGRTWVDRGSASGVVVSDIFDLTFDPADPDTLYAATGAGLFRSPDGGDHWEVLGAGEIGQAGEVAVLDSGTLLVSACGIQRSTDGGETWTEVFACQRPGDSGFDDSARSIVEFWLDPERPGTVYAESFEYQGRHPVSFYTNLYKSEDGGLTWRQILVDGVAMALDPRQPRTVYAFQQRFLRPDAFLRSPDGGRTWRRVSGLDANVTDLRVDPATPTTFYASTSDQGVFRSTDSGRTWKPVNAGLSPLFGGILARELVVHPTLPHRIYAAANEVFFETRF
ncbi:MAG TPA: hypothetical protein VHU81_06685 [Thermoanaerobaculia bacterium]|nr:hypothetical protein [Thermoanaerobaculia bacterium]